MSDYTILQAGASDKELALFYAKHIKCKVRPVNAKACTEFYANVFAKAKLQQLEGAREAGEQAFVEELANFVATMRPMEPEQVSDRETDEAVMTITLEEEDEVERLSESDSDSESDCDSESGSVTTRASIDLDAYLENSDDQLATGMSPERETPAPSVAAPPPSAPADDYFLPGHQLSAHAMVQMKDRCQRTAEVSKRQEEQITILRGQLQKYQSQQRRWSENAKQVEENAKQLEKETKRLVEADNKIQEREEAVVLLEGSLVLEQKTLELKESLLVKREGAVAEKERAVEEDRKATQEGLKAMEEARKATEEGLKEMEEGRKVTEEGRKAMEKEKRDIRLEKERMEKAKNKMKVKYSEMKMEEQKWRKEKEEWMKEKEEWMKEKKRKEDGYWAIHIPIEGDQISSDPLLCVGALEVGCFDSPTCAHIYVRKDGDEWALQYGNSKVTRPAGKLGKHECEGNGIFPPSKKSRK